jgi:hypothetical protein
LLLAGGRRRGGKRGDKAGNDERPVSHNGFFGQRARAWRVQLKI